uniref:NET domain-containing protein n=1 Tax=viral metagenome TaxID=1070528 RepID=A0A6C0JBY0_9ZZZZ
MNMEKLNKLKNIIDNLDKIHHLKIFKVLKDNNVKFSENRNGIFINMNSFDENTIKNIELTLQYINRQEKQLLDIETIKYDLKQDFFIQNVKEVKDNITNNVITNEF